MFIQSVERLINAETEDAEEQALGMLLRIARETNVNYGYRVFDKTRSKRVSPDELTMPCSTTIWSSRYL